MSTSRDNTFKGFSPGKHRQVVIPAQFFSDLLPLIDTVAELHLTLFCFRAVQQKAGEFRFLRYADFREDEALMNGLIQADPAADPDNLLDDALEACCVRGTLLCADVTLAQELETLYFLNTERGRSAVEQIGMGNWQPGADEVSIEILPERPNIYSLYEQNIGALTAYIADELKDAEADYSAAWVAEAIRLSVEENKRNWRYIRAILQRWKKEGKPNDEITERDSLSDGQRYASGKYADFIDN